ncbi:MAG: PD-(D/E)XK nuclease family protein, partial [Verrucomicrobia bacterium]|nr:PD-(D/E)XK nuclease family protein [Verrucomicrobiota bacterium]
LSRLKKLLGGPLIGWDHERISGTFDKEALREAKEKALVLQDTLHQSGFSSFFREFLTSAWGRDLSVEEHLLSQGHLDLYCDLEQLAEIIVETAWTQKRASEKWTALLDEIRSSSIEDDTRLKRRIGSDEDAVQILTMHMSKGLEFDIVFALGVASSHPLQDEIVIQDEGRSKIVPLELDSEACSKSLKEIDAEKLRQLYVALTRAKKRVYIPLPFDLKNNPVPLGEASPIELYFSAASLPSFDFAHVEAFLDEIKNGASITLSRIELAPATQVQEKKSVLLDLPPKELSPFPAQPIVSYSSLAKKADPEMHFIEKLENKDEMSTALNMPLGAQTGLIFHSIMEKLFQYGLHFFPQQKKIADLIEKQTANTTLSLWKGPLFETIWDLLHMPLKGFSLSEIPPAQIQEEMEFLFPFEKGLMKGFADLVFESKKKYYLLDWKTNYLGPSLQDYSSENILKSMDQHDYFLQASIYAEALKRYVKLFDKRPFSECFGGVFYIFVRGKVVHHIDGSKLEFQVKS